MIDLFGNKVADTDAAKTMLLRVLGPLHYRPSDNPEKRCNTCCHFFVKKYSKTYYKCDRLRCSNSSATDIRAKHVCDGWEKIGAVVGGNE